jgi:hypothetical protein
MGDDDSALWGGELGCSETGYSPKCLEGVFCEVRQEICKVGHMVYCHTGSLPRYT